MTFTLYPGSHPRAKSFAEARVRERGDREGAFFPKRPRIVGSIALRDARGASGAMWGGKWVQNDTAMLSSKRGGEGSDGRTDAG